MKHREGKELLTGHRPAAIGTPQAEGWGELGKFPPLQRASHQHSSPPGTVGRELGGELRTCE